MYSERITSTKSTAPTSAIHMSVPSNAEFEAIFEQNYGLVRAYLWRHVGHDADDIASETFLIAYKKRDSLKALEGSSRAWLLGIATNLLRHHWRSERRQLRAYARTGSDLFEIDEDSTAASDSKLDAQRQGALIAGALASLPAIERNVLTLYAWAGLSNPEIALALGVPEGTVRSRLHRARLHMRERLGRIGNV